MNRRDVLRAGTAAALSTLNARAYATTAQKPRRVGLIGTGWFGKHDVTRLIQIEPVDVVSLCDVDRKMVEQAGELIQLRQDDCQGDDRDGEQQVEHGSAILEPELQLIEG